ncbi:hypothetical protein Z043_101456 [Scleropages formosus]|uniref:acylphosphatase n=1 Tax=Scleropages formosus TaxID=113540 RepID=A0A0P7UXE3_SCLFO|nr:hypothetical protein Z043_101456 [Scleropages formosus]
MTMTRLPSRGLIQHPRTPHFRSPVQDPIPSVSVNNDRTLILESGKLREDQEGNAENFSEMLWVGSNSEGFSDKNRASHRVSPCPVERAAPVIQDKCIDQGYYSGKVGGVEHEPVTSGLLSRKKGNVLDSALWDILDVWTWCQVPHCAGDPNPAEPTMSQEPTEGAKLRSVDFEIFGHVQGVCFRMYSEAEGQRLGLSGWVKNTRRGTVVGQVQGPPHLVNEIKEEPPADCSSPAEKHSSSCHLEQTFKEAWGLGVCCLQPSYSDPASRLGNLALGSDTVQANHGHVTHSTWRQPGCRGNKDLSGRERLLKKDLMQSMLVTVMG